MLATIRDYLAIDIILYNYIKFDQSQSRSAISITLKTQHTHKNCFYSQLCQSESLTLMCVHALMAAEQSSPISSIHKLRYRGNAMLTSDCSPCLSA